MFSPLLSWRLSWRHNTAFRIAVGHTAIYVLSFVVLFLVVDSTVSRLLHERDLQIVSNELTAVAEEYGEKGVPEVASYVAEGHSSATNLVRVADANNRTLFASPLAPARIIAELEKNIGKPQPKRRILRITGDDAFDVETATLPDGVMLQAGLSARSRTLFLNRFRRICVICMLPTIIFGIFGGMLLAERTLRPLRDLGSTIRRILRTGKLDERIELKRAPSDLLQIVRSFNAMLARIEALVGSIRDSVDNVAHELRTPMTRLRCLAETGLRNSSNVALAQNALGTCVEECDHVMSVLDVLMDLAEAEAGVMKIQPQTIDLLPLIRRIADLYEIVADNKALQISVEVPDQLKVSADPNRLPQAVANLVDNAVKYTPEGGEIVISGWRANGEVALSVKDTGIGIPTNEADKIWERLYRADKSRSERGLGLGLTVVKAIVEAHRGRVTLDSQPDRGSVFTLYFPAS